MMTDLNKVVKVALIALTMLVGAQSASADDVTVEKVVEATKTPFGFAAQNSRTATSAYNITGGGVYTVDEIEALIEGIARNTTVEVGGKKVIVLTSDGTAMDKEILDAITDNDIIVFDGTGGTSRTFFVNAQVNLTGLSNKTIIGLNGACLATKWYLTDVIKSWLNAVETSSGSGVSNASTASGTGGSFYLKNVAGEDSLLITIDEEGEYLTRKTLADKGSELYQKWLADKAAATKAGTEVPAMPENAYFLRTERYKKSGVFYVEGCSNLIIRNLSFQGPGSVDVGGVDLVSVINGTNHVWVDHCEFIDGQDGNFDITNESDYITASWCHFHYTDRSYVHQNTNLVGSSDSKVEDRGKLNITFAYNEWGENCRSRMPMGRFGKIHLLNNWYNCAGNTENAVNPRLESEYLIDGNYFASGVTKTFKANGSTGVSAKDNTMADLSATKIESSGSAVTVPYTYSKVASNQVPDMIELLVGPVLDKRPTYTLLPGGVNNTTYEYNTTSTRASQGLTFSVWADNTMSYQWYANTEATADTTAAKRIKDATLNSYTCTITKDSTVYIYCVASGLAGKTVSKLIKIEVSGTGAPIINDDLTSYEKGAYEAAKGISYSGLFITATGAETYQWYHNTSASYEGATEVTGQTTATLTYTTPSGDDADRTDFYFCVVTSYDAEQDTTFTVKSKIARVKYVDRQTLINFEATAIEPGTTGGGKMDGLTLVGNVTKDNSVKVNGTKYYSFKCGSSVSKTNNHIKVEPTGGFQVGDKLVLSGYVKADGYSDDPRGGDYIKKWAKIQVLDKDGNQVNITDTVINVQYHSALDPAESVYEFTQAYDYVLIGRNGGTSMYINKILVTRGDPTAPVKPYITTDLGSNYESTTTKAVSGLSIVAEDATSYAWYKCSGIDSYETGKTPLEGQTTSTCSHIFTSAGTYYVYGVAINGTGDAAKRDTSSIATVVITKATSIPLRYTWDIKDWNSTFNKSAADGTEQNFGATEDPSQVMTYFGKASGINSDPQTVADSTWTHNVQTGGGSTCTGKKVRVLKYHAPYPGKLIVYAKGGSTSARHLYIYKSLPASGNSSVTGCATLDGEGQKADKIEYTIEDEEDVYIWDDNSFKIYGIVALLDMPTGVCANPSISQGAWSGDSNQTWRYTIRTTTETAKIVYTINDGIEQESETNSKVIDLSPGDKISARAVDTAIEDPLSDSKVVSLTVPAAEVISSPTFSVSTYDVAERGFKIQIKNIATGGKCYYTTDGSDPVVGESSEYSPSSTFYVDPNTTVKAVVAKEFYTPSSVVSVTTTALSRPSGSELITIKNVVGQSSGKDVIGASYKLPKGYNGGAPNVYTDKNGLKMNPRSTSSSSYPGKYMKEELGLSYGVPIAVNDGFVIDSLYFRGYNNYDPTSDSKYESTLTSVYVHGNTTPVASPNLVFGDKKTEQKYMVKDLNASDTIYLGFSGGSSQQLNTQITVYYHIVDAPAKVTINGVDSLMSTFKANVLTVDPAKITYNEDPTMKLVTTNGYEYPMTMVPGDNDGYTKYASPTFENNTIYYVKVKVKAINAPMIDVNGSFELVKPDANHITSSATTNGGYEVTLSDIKDATTPYIIIDSDIDSENARDYKAVAQMYDPNKKYYALKSVRAFCSYTDPETSKMDSTVVRTYESFPENSYDPDKPFAVYLYTDGYSDTGAGQEKATQSSTFNPATDQIHLGLADQFNVLDYHKHKDDVKDKMVNEVYPDIRNAKLVVISEMIGSGSATSGSVYESSGASNFSMSLRDSLINYTNVFNLKMFFYSQSKNNNQRWAWAQPATLMNTVVSIKPTNPMYMVFKNVEFSSDGTLQLWSGFDDESELNRLQLVHNYNEDNENLPSFVSLAKATDIDGEEYDALHFFETKVDETTTYTYIGTGISVNDNEHYSKNLRYLTSTIGEMIKEGTSLSTVMTEQPAPRIKDNGNGSATITNNNASAYTYYSVYDTKQSPAPSAETIASAGETTKGSLTKKYSTKKYIYAVSKVGNTLSAVAFDSIAGNTKRYFHRLNTDAAAEGVETSIEYAYNAESITVPYNQTFRKDGWTVTSWKEKFTGATYTPGQVISDPGTIGQDLYLEAVWTKNEKTITDSDGSEAQRTVTWNFLQSDGAPGLSLEYGSTRLAQQGFIVGQLTFSDGTFIDIPMEIDVDNTTTLPGSNTVYNGKFNNKQNVLSDATKYVTEFAQVRAGTKFTFPAVYGMKVYFKQADFEKYDGAGKRERDKTYVTQSIIISGNDTTEVSNKGLVTDGTGAVASSGVVGVANDNLTTGGIFNYAFGTDTIATLITRECARYENPSKDTSSKTVGALNYGTAFMESLSVTYPALYDITKNISMPGHVGILPGIEDMSDDEIKARAAKVTMTAGEKNCDGRYAVGTTVKINIVPGYSFYFDTEAAPKNVTATGLTGDFDIKTKSASGSFTVGTSPTLNITLLQKPVKEFSVDWTPATAGSVRVTSNTGKDDVDEYTAFPVDSIITFSPSPKLGYKFKHWENADGVIYKTSSDPLPDEEYRDPTTIYDVDSLDYGVLNLKVTDYNANLKYVARFEESVEGTVRYRVSYAGLKNGNIYTDFSDIWPASIPGREAADTTALFNYYRFPKERTANALYIPTNYTLYKKGYTLSHWAYIENFDPNRANKDWSANLRGEYQIGKFYYFDHAGEKRDIIPIFEQNVAGNAAASENLFKYRHTTADITWDFRRAYYAQYLEMSSPTEFDYATHAVINNNDTIDVALHINATSANNKTMDEWCHFGEGTEITIPSGLGAKFTLVTSAKLTTTTLGGEVPLEYVKVNKNNVDVYTYTYTTHSADTTITLHIGSDHCYYKSIRAQLPTADDVTLTTTVNNAAWGTHATMLKANTTEVKIKNPAEANDVRYATETGTNTATYTMPLGSYVKIKADRKRLYELKAFVIDGDTISVETAADITAAADKGYTITKPADDSTNKEYTLIFRLYSYATTVEAVYQDRKTYQITYDTGSQAYGEAPGVVVVEKGESFKTPKCNQTLYLEGYTLKYWLDEDGNKYEWNTEYQPGVGSVPLKDIYLSPVFEINDFTLFDIPAAGATVEWPLSTGTDATYGGAPLLKYQKSAGVYVSQLQITSGVFNGKFIDLNLDIDCTGSSAKVDNSATDYRCQINSGSIVTVPTNDNCTITLVTSNGELSTTKIAGATKSNAATKSSKTVATAYGSGRQETGSNDYVYSTTYTGSDASQDIEFMGDAGYFKMVKVQYGATKSKEDLPELAQVTIDNIALGSIGTDYESKTLKSLQENNSITIPVTLSSTATAMPKVKAKADADHSNAIISITQATVADTTATIIVKTAAGATVGIYKIVFSPEYETVPDPVIRKIEMNRILVKGRNVTEDLVTYLEKGTRMNVNGAITLTFDHKMKAAELPADIPGKAYPDSCNFKQEITASGGSTTLSFSYWNLDVDTEYIFTIPANTLVDEYGNKFKEAISFRFRTAETSQIIDKRNVDFVVTHRQTHTFNTANPEENYNSTAKRQVASNELIANLQAAGIPYGTIDEGIAMAHDAGGANRFYIFVPDGEYQLRGNNATDAISSANSSGDAPADNSGKLRPELIGKKIYNGVTAIKRDNLSITGQSMDGVKLWNLPEIEGISYTATFMVNNGVSGFYVQDMTLQNAYDYKTSTLKQSTGGRAVVLRDRGSKTIMKNVTMDSWQDTYYSNTSNQYNDTRGYFENCVIKGYVDFICGDGDHWFENCTLMMRNGKTGNASNMTAPATYASQKWGYVFNNCAVTSEDDVTYTTCNNKFTLARPWKNSPAVSYIGTTFKTLPSADGYKQMSNVGLVLRMHEYMSYDAEGARLDLSTRSLRASSPGAGSYAAVMTPAEAEEYSMHDVLGGTDGYDPKLYTKSIDMDDAELTSVDRSLTWNEKSEALCYFIFRKNNKGGFDLYAITSENSYELNDDQIGRTFIVRAANQRGGLGEPSEEFEFNVHESYQLEITDANPSTTETVNDVVTTWKWSTIYLDYNAKAPTKADDSDEENSVFVYAVVTVNPTSMVLKRVGTLNANEGYIVKGKVGTYTFAYTDSDGKYNDGTTEVAGSDAAKEDRLSVLDGVVEQTAVGGMDVYTMTSKTKNGLGFYKYTGTYLNAYKAYLNGSYVPEGGEMDMEEGEEVHSLHGFIFLDDEATSISKLTGADDDSEKIYTISGQRVKHSEMIKGRVYIINGRKIAY